MTSSEGSSPYLPLFPRMTWCATCQDSSAKIARLFAALGCAALFLFGSGDVKPQTFPDRPVQINVGQQAGGALDTMARHLATGLSQLWGQPVIVVNKPGGAAILAVQETVKAKPDGYTLALAPEGPLTRSQFLVANLGYDPIKDLTPISLVAVVPMVLVVNPNLMKVSDLRSFVTLAKASPGKINYASAGIGGSHHILMARLEKAAGIQLNQIPYKGGAPALTDVLGGHIPVMFSGVPTALPFIKSGKLIPLGFIGAERSMLLPSVPTFQEQGFLGDASGDWSAIVAPKDTPADIVRKIAADIAVVSRSAVYQGKLQVAGLEVKLISGQELGDLIVRTASQNKEIFRAAGIVPE